MIISVHLVLKDGIITRALMMITIWSLFASFTYYSFIKVEKLHKTQIPLSRDIIQSSSVDDNNIDGDNDEISLYSFFNISNKFYQDAKYNQRLTTKFEQFTKFIIHEFSSENLLFVINIIQFKQFLIEYNYTTKEYWKQQRFEYQLNDFINPTRYIQKLIVLHNDSNSSISVNRDNYDSLIPFLKIVFCQFIIVNKAPFEVNISHILRTRTTNHFENVLSTNLMDFGVENSNTDTERGCESKLTEAVLLNEILPDLMAICDECMQMILFSWIRYTSKQTIGIKTKS